ncbi:MAG: hypothetical protein RL085_41 [Actinomycetota bacterium]|jgi:hypothetical protein
MYDFSEFVSRDTSDEWDAFKQVCANKLVAEDRRANKIVKSLSLENVPFEDLESLPDAHLWIDFSWPTDFTADLGDLVDGLVLQCVAQDILKPATQEEVLDIRRSGGAINVVYTCAAPSEGEDFELLQFVSGLVLHCARCVASCLDELDSEDDRELFEFEPSEHADFDCPACFGEGYWDLDFFDGAQFMASGVSSAKRDEQQDLPKNRFCGACGTGFENNEQKFCGNCGVARL